MKYLFFVFFCTTANLFCQDTLDLDPTFERVLLQDAVAYSGPSHSHVTRADLHTADLNGDGRLAKEELSRIRALYLKDKGLTSIKGIQYFDSLTFLRCDRNALTHVSISGLKHLNRINLEHNSLKTLELRGLDSLEILWCSGNALTACRTNELPRLKDLACSMNELTTLDVSNNPRLEFIDCKDNQLTDLDLSGLQNLHSIYCRDNPLRTLNVLQTHAQLRLNAMGMETFDRICIEDSRLHLIEEDLSYGALRSHEIHASCPVNPRTAAAFKAFQQQEREARAVKKTIDPQKQAALDQYLQANYVFRDTIMQYEIVDNQIHITIPDAKIMHWSMGYVFKDSSGKEHFSSRKIITKYLENGEHTTLEVPELASHDASELTLHLVAGAEWQSFIPIYNDVHKMNKPIHTITYRSNGAGQLLPSAKEMQKIRRIRYKVNDLILNEFDEATRRFVQSQVNRIIHGE